VVGEIDNGFLALVANEFRLVLGRQHNLGVILLAGNVPDAHFDGPRVPLLAISADIFEQLGVMTVALDGVGTVKYAFAPTCLTTMQCIGAIVLRQLNFLAIEVLDQAIFDAIRNPTDGCTVVWGVVFHVVLLRGETQNDVLAIDTELLDDGAQRQEFKCGLFGGHDLGLLLLPSGRKMVGEKESR
jgi:hypothetical protein